MKLSTIDIPKKMQGAKKMRSSIEILALLQEITLDEKLQRRYATFLTRVIADFLKDAGYHGCDTDENAQDCAEQLVAIRTIRDVGKGDTRPQWTTASRALKYISADKQRKQLREIVRTWNKGPGKRLQDKFKKAGYALDFFLRKRDRI